MRTGGSPATVSTRLRTAALLDHHAGQVPVHDVHVIVVVQHRDGGDASRRAARTAVGCRHGRRAASRSTLLLLLLPLLLDHVRVGVLLEVEKRTVAGAVERRIAAWHDDEVPAERLEVDDERIATASLLCTVLVAVQVEVPF